MKRALIVTCVFLLLCLLAGSSRSATAANIRYVRQADVTLYRQGTSQTRIYLQPQKIKSILNFLRITQPRGSVYAAPADPQSHHYHIQLHFSDGSQSSYYLQDYRYFRKNSGLWQRVCPTLAGLLYPLLQLLPPDG